MLLYISNSKTVEDLQDHFNECFPYLKIEFYKGAASSLKNCDKAYIVRPETPLGEIRRKSNAGTLDIKSWEKTSKLKQDLKDLYDLNVQIFRMHGQEWIPTSYSDDLSLKQQSELARQYVPF
ncbi:MAG: hypothetical protein ACXVLT_02545 [Flavisolibacter sp.]